MSSIFAALTVSGWIALLVLGVGGTVAFVWASLAAARSGSPTAGPGSTLVFRYRPLARGFAVCFAVGGLGFATSRVVVHSPTNPVSVAILYALFGGMGAGLVWDVFRFRMAVGPDGLDCRSPWRPRRFIRWDEVVTVSFPSPLAYFEVRATNGSVVRLPALVGGLGAFLEACEKRLTPSQLEPARMAYIYLGRAFPEE